MTLNIIIIFEILEEIDNRKLIDLNGRKITYI